MSILKLKGSSSGYVELTAPATAGNNQITLPTTAGTVAVRDASNNVEVGTGTTIGSPSSNVFTVSTNGSERVRVSSAGSFAIGTSAPDERLHITGATSSNTTVKVQSTASAAERSSIEFFNNAISRGRIGGANDFDGLTIDSSSTESAAVIRFRTGGGTLTEKARIDSSGRLLVGTTSVISNNYGGTSGLLQVAKNDYLPIGFFTYSNTSGETGYCPYIELNRAKGTQASPTVVASADDLGLVNFYGHDGSTFVRAAVIKAVVDGTPGANDMPGRLVFATTSDGASSPTERARITSGGFFKAKADTVYQSETGTYHEFSSNISSTTVLNVLNKNASYAGPLLNGGADRAASSAYDFQNWYSAYSGTFDLEFRLRGDGNGLCDGAWTGGGADYAEYFEWSDANPDEEDRRGISVVLEENKIREAVAGEDPIGVISGNPSVVGDAAWNKWSGKYLRDEYGTYVQEDYEVTDEDGNTVIQQRRKLNPEYDPDVEYIPREQRPEWDCVGLMGKLRVRKGQITGSRWIKMRDVSATVEEWLVR